MLHDNVIYGMIELRVRLIYVHIFYVTLDTEVYKSTYCVMKFAKHVRIAYTRMINVLILHYLQNCWVGSMKLSCQPHW